MEKDWRSGEPKPVGNGSDLEFEVIENAEDDRLMISNHLITLSLVTEGMFTSTDTSKTQFDLPGFTNKP